MVEIAHQTLHAAQVAGQHLAGLGGLERRVVSNMLHDPHERRGIELGALSDGFDQLQVVGRRTGSVEPQERSKDDENGTEARRQQLELAILIVPSSEQALSQSEQLAHRLLLQLETKVLEVDV